MINLFNSFDDNTKALYRSFALSGIQNQTIIIEDDGFLPEGCLSPYIFFAKKYDSISTPLYFNEVIVPKYWEVEGHNSSAVIKDMGETKARIIYKQNAANRIVQRIEWLDNRGKTKIIDYYNKYGERFSQLLVDESQKPIIKKYFNSDNQEIIYENMVTKDIILTWEGKEYFFASKAEFVVFFLERSGLSLNSFLINSLSTPLIVLFKLNNTGIDYLFWQENINEELPYNMQKLMSRENRDYKIIVPGPKEYKALKKLANKEKQSHIECSGYVYKYYKQNNFSNNVLTLTNSDSLPHLEAIIQKNRNLNFHIVAKTEMSQKLVKFNEYDNVLLFPRAKKKEIQELYQKCDLYLDINKGGELSGAVRNAFDHNLLILGYKEIAHDKTMTAEENLFEINNYSSLITTLNEVNKEEEHFKRLLNLQSQNAHAIDKEEFILKVR